MIPEETALLIRKTILDSAHDDIHAGYERVPSQNDFVEQVAPLIRAAVEAEREKHRQDFEIYACHLVGCLSNERQHGVHREPCADCTCGFTGAAIRARAQTTERCTHCGQIDFGQYGEYPCPICGLPTLHNIRNEMERAA